jgi:hypothetical protein
MCIVHCFCNSIQLCGSGAQRIQTALITSDFTRAICGEIHRRTIQRLVGMISASQLKVAMSKRRLEQLGWSGVFSACRTALTFLQGLLDGTFHSQARYGTASILWATRSN